MDSLWLKIKVWTKLTVLTLVLAYILFFFFENNVSVTIWVWFGHEIQTNMLMVIVCVLLTGVIGTLLTRPVLRTIRQLKELRTRNQAARIERDLAEIKARASMLQTKPRPSDTPTMGAGATAPAPSDTPPSSR